MLKQAQHQSSLLSTNDIKTLNKIYSLEALHYNWPVFERIVERNKKALLGTVNIVFPHWREAVLAPISVQLNELYRKALETEANTWSLTVYIENNMVYIRKLRERPEFMEEWEI